MKHNWAFQEVKQGPASLIPIATYKCDTCERIERIYLNATNALVEILTLDDCKGKKVDNSPGAMLDRASDKLYNNTFIEGDLRYILDCLISSCMIINNRTKDD